MACDFFAEILTRAPLSDRSRKSPSSSRWRIAIFGADYGITRCLPRDSRGTRREGRHEFRGVVPTAGPLDCARNDDGLPRRAQDEFLTEKLPDLRQARLDVGLADLDDPPRVLRLEHEQGDEVG